MQLLLNNVRSLHNVGSIFRSAAAAGCSHMYLCGLTPTPPRSEITKTALGGTEAVSWSYHQSAREAITVAGDCVCAALELTSTAVNIFEETLPKNLLLIVGHERAGVEPELLQFVSTHYQIPLVEGPVHSLNVSNATAIALFEYRRQHPL